MCTLMPTLIECHLCSRALVTTRVLCMLETLCHPDKEGTVYAV